MASEQRIQKLKELLEKDPTDSFSRYALALEYMGMSDLQTAIEELETLISTDPKYLAAYHQLGQIYGKLNRTQEAKKVYRKGIDLAQELGEEKEGKEMREELEELEDEW
jgi:Tfp pilus assembly protein PilF